MKASSDHSFKWIFFFLFFCTTLVGAGKTQNSLQRSVPQVNSGFESAGYELSHLFLLISISVFLIIFLLLVIVVINALRFRREALKREEDEKGFRKQIFSLAERFRITLNSIGDGVVATDVRTRIMLMNPVASELIGVSVEKSFGKYLNTVLRLTDSQSGDSQVSLLKEVLEDGKKIKFEKNIVLVAGDGSRRHVSCSATPIRDDQEQIVGAVLILRDVSGEYEQNLRMQTALQTLEYAAERANLTYFDSEMDGSDPHCGCNDLQNWKFTDGKPVRAREWVYHEDYPHFRSEFDELMSGRKKEIIVEYRSNHMGSMRFYRLSALQWKAPESGENRLFGVLQDITGIGEAERKYSDANALLTTMINTLPCLVFIKNVSDDFRYLVANPTYAEFFGRKPEEMIGKTDLEIFGENEFGKQFNLNDEEVARFDVPVGRTERIFNSEGVCRYLHGVKGIVKQADGKTLLVGMATDVTDIELAKQRVEESKRLLQAILDHVPVGIMLKDPEKNYEYILWNKAFEKFSGVPSSEVIGKNDENVEIYQDNSDLFRQEDIQAVSFGQKLMFVEEVRTRKGDNIVFLTHKLPFEAEPGRTFLLGLCVDITKEWTLEKEQRALIGSLNEYIDNEKMLNQCLTMITVENNLDRAINFILKRVGKNRNADRCYVYRCLQDSSIAGSCYEWVKEGIPAQLSQFSQINGAKLEEIRQQLLEQKYISIDDAGKPSKLLDLFYEIFGSLLDAKSMQVCPVWDGDRLWGILGLDFVREQRCVSDADREALNSAGTLFMLAMERKRQMALVEESVSLRNQIVDNIVIPIAMFDRNYKIITVNRAMADSVSSTVPELLGKKCCEVLCKSEQPPPWCPLEKVFAEKSPVKGEFKKGDGSCFSLSAQPIVDAAGNTEYVFEAVIDMTAHYQQQAALQAGNELLTAYIKQDQTINECLESLLLNSVFRESLEHVLHRITVQLGANTCSVFRGVDNGERFLCVESWGYGENDRRKIPELRKSDFPNTFECLMHDGVISQDSTLVPETPLQKELAGYLTQRNANALLCAGIFYKGKYWGHIGSQCITPGKVFSSAEERMMRAAARVIEVLIERDYNQKQLVRSESERMRIFSMLDIPLLLLDKKRRILRANPAAENLTGKKEAELRHEICHVCSDLSADSENCCVLASLKTGQPQQMSKVINGRSFQLKTLPFIEDGVVVNVLISFVDMTDVYLQQDKLKQAMAEAQAADRAKSFFLATMSHEIRTPLNAVIGFSELLQNEQLSVEEQMEYLRSINFAGNALLHLINDILDLSKIEAGQMNIVARKMCFPELCAEIQAIFLQKAQEKKLSFSLNIQEDIPQLYLDSQRLRQVLLNVVGNAIKFTEKGFVILAAAFVSDNRETGTLSIEIMDSGIGMSDEFVCRIFEPFIQDNTARDRAYQGSGLGLSISYRLVKKMDGVLEVRSKLGQGSCFSVVLHNVRYEKAETGPETGPKTFKFYPQFPKNNALKIMIVDDVAMNLKVLGAILAYLGFECVEAASGAQALALLENITPSLILSDVWMPEMSGIVLAEKIRKNPRLHNCRIVAVTADAEVDGAFNMEHFDALLLKPISLEKLKNLLAASKDRNSFVRTEGMPLLRF